jgi:branched-chain amino acid aminotransferase
MFQCWKYNFELENLVKYPIVNEKQSMEEFVLSLPEGVYTVLRTVGKLKIFQFRYHLNRLIESYSLSQRAFPYDINKIRAPLFEVIKEFPTEEIRIRIHISFNLPCEAYLIFEELTTPGKFAYENGVSVNTNKLSRNNPKAKLTSFIRRSEHIKKYCLKNQLEDSILINSENQLLEGLSSNFFAVLHNKIYTADSEVLSGATRDIILDEARKANFEIHFVPITYNQIDSLDEAFISSTSRGLLPVVKIDDVQIGNGIPGKVSKFLLRKLNERMFFESENII